VQSTELVLVRVNQMCGVWSALNLFNKTPALSPTCEVTKTVPGGHG